MITGLANEPYVGLRPYGAEDTGRFFGRSREAWELASLVLSSRFVVLYGPAGVGKTSLLQAGLLPELRGEAVTVLPVARLPRTPARTTVGPKVEPPPNPFVRSLLSTWSPDDAAAPPAAPPAGSTLAEHLAAMPVRRAPFEDTALPMVALVDQFEEVFGDGAGGMGPREELIDQLATAIADVPHLHVVVALRQDAVGELLAYEPRLHRGTRRRFRLDGLDRRSAVEAVAAPLATTSRAFAEGAADRLVDRLTAVVVDDGPGAPPLLTTELVEPSRLQVVCLALWRTLEEDDQVITAEEVTSYLERAGDVEATLMLLCAQATMDVASETGQSELDLWDWLEGTFVTEQHTRNTAPEGTRSTGGLPLDVARAFESRRILRSEKRIGTIWYELMHDALIEPIRQGRQVAHELAVMVGTTEVGPGIGAAYLRMARAALSDGRLAVASRYVQGAIRASQGDLRQLAEANAFLGELVLDQGRTATGRHADELYASAEGSFRQAAALFDLVQDARAVGRQQVALGRLYLERGRFVEAIGELRNALERLQGDVGACLDFARALGSSGRTQAAIGEYTSALTRMVDETTAERVEALLGRGILGAHHGDAPSALRDLDDAVRLDPSLAGRPEVVIARRRATARLPRRLPQQT